MRRVERVLILAVVLAATSSPAAAQPTDPGAPGVPAATTNKPAPTVEQTTASDGPPPPAAPSAEPSGEAPTSTAAPAPPPSRGNYFLNGGAVPFFYVPVAIAVAAELGSPRSAPLLFSAEEGAAERREETIPNYQVAVIGGALTLALGAFDRDARWYHFKGMLESLATTASVTQLAKIGFGRHRPSYDPATSTNEDDRMSFFSGHASLTAASAVYFGLYLRQHAFRPWRGDRVLAWWEVPAYAGLAALATYVPYTRYVDHKHHLSDLLVGATVGSAIATGMYIYQESRYRGARAEPSRSISVVPWTGAAGASISGTL